MKLQKIYKILLKQYGKQGWWPQVKNGKLIYNKNKQLNNKFEIILGAILTQNTSWKNVEKTILALNKLNLIKKNAIKQLSQKNLAKLIKSSGYYNQKAKKIKSMINFLDSKKEITRKNLLEVWGIGPETADSILLYAYQQPVFVIDAYTKRIMSRLGFQQKTYQDLQLLFHDSIPKNHKIYSEYHALLVRLAKEHCRTKPTCDNCPLNDSCESMLHS